LNFITKKIHERAERNRIEDQRRKTNKAAVDKELDDERDTMYKSAYKTKRKQRMKQEIEQQVNHDAGGNRLNGMFSPVAGTGKKVRHAGNAARSGLDFLSGGDIFGGMGGGGASTSKNIEDMLGFGNSRPTQLKPKSKRTTIHTGGKTITISENAAEGEAIGKKKGKNYWDNLDDIMNQELPF
jgi:hypothetical protein